MATAIQYAAAPVVHADCSGHYDVVKFETIDLDASETLESTVITATGDQQAYLCVFKHDATAGSATITVENDTGNLTLTKAIVVQGGPPADSLVVSGAASPKHVVFGIAPTAGVYTNGVLTTPMAATWNLNFVSDGSWNGTTAELCILQVTKRHLP